MPDRAPTAPLFDAVVAATLQAYGPRATPRAVTISTYNGLEVTFHIPHGWQPSENVPVIRGVDCFAEVLATLVQAGKRMTRAALMDDMARLDRKRAESAVCVALEDLMKLGVVDNRQDVTPKGYAIRGSD